MFRRRGGAARSIAALGAVLLLTFVAACGSNGESEDVPLASVTVTSGARTSAIADNEFESPMRVTVGSEVTWVNEDGVAHNVVGEDRAFRSETLKKGDTFTHRFDTAGRYEYTCTFHPGMDGVVEVE